MASAGPCHCYSGALLKEAGEWNGEEASRATKRRDILQNGPKLALPLEFWSSPSQNPLISLRRHHAIQRRKDAPLHHLSSPKPVLGLRVSTSPVALTYKKSLRVKGEGDWRLPRPPFGESQPSPSGAHVHSSFPHYTVQ